MPANREPLHEASDRHSYYFRRPLKAKDYVSALAIGLAAGVAAFYVATRFSQRTPLLRGDQAVMPRRIRRKTGIAG
jgi:hypothetical protein